jgi:hypothetical protein
VHNAEETEHELEEAHKVREAAVVGELLPHFEEAVELGQAEHALCAEQTEQTERKETMSKR